MRIARLQTTLEQQNQRVSIHFGAQELAIVSTVKVDEAIRIGPSVLLQEKIPLDSTASPLVRRPQSRPQLNGTCSHVTALRITPLVIIFNWRPHGRQAISFSLVLIFVESLYLDGVFEWSRSRMILKWWASTHTCSGHVRRPSVEIRKTFENLFSLARRPRSSVADRGCDRTGLVIFDCLIFPNLSLTVRAHTTYLKMIMTTFVDPENTKVGIRTLSVVGKAECEERPRGCRWQLRSYFEQQVLFFVMDLPVKLHRTFPVQLSVEGLVGCRAILLRIPRHFSHRRIRPSTQNGKQQTRPQPIHVFRAKDCGKNDWFRFFPRFHRLRKVHLIKIKQSFCHNGKSIAVFCLIIKIDSPFPPAFLAYISCQDFFPNKHEQTFLIGQGVIRLCFKVSGDRFDRPKNVAHIFTTPVQARAKCVAA